jgi:opacity protein-like surface antigen
MATLPASVRDMRRLLLIAALATGCATAPPAPRFDAPVWSPADDGPTVATATPPLASTELDPHTSFDAPPGPVQEAASQSANILKPYLWAAGVNGNVKAHGVDADVDESFSDILDSLDFGLMLAYEHQFENGNSLLVDSLYIKLTDDATVSHVDVNSELELGFLEVDGAFPLADKYGIDAIAGVRGWWTHLDIDAPPVADVSPSWQWLDPVVGARWSVPLAEKWALAMRGDIGGFGIGSACDFTWQGLAAATYEMSEQTKLGFGYRYMRIDRDSGSGAGERKVDLALSGFIAGLEFRF